MGEVLVGNWGGWCVYGWMLALSGWCLCVRHRNAPPVAQDALPAPDAKAARPAPAAAAVTAAKAAAPDRSVAGPMTIDWDEE